ncbi:MAG: glycosyltransferase family 2 protein [Planctomycetaceae bacterium]
MPERPPGNPPTPQISIITPCRNAGQFLKRNIESVRDQTGVTVEHIVIDSASTDETRSILESYPHVIWVSEPDRGQSHAFNKGVNMATAPLIGWLNADDWYTPGALQTVTQHFGDYPQSSIINGHLERVDADGTVIEFLRAAYSPWKLTHFWFGWYGLNHPATFYRAEVFQQVGPVDESLQYAMDYDFYLRASRHCDFRDLDFTTTHMLVHSQSKTSQGWKPFADDIRHTITKVWEPEQRLFAIYAMAGLRSVEARRYLVDSFLALRDRDSPGWSSSLCQAFERWPPLLLLPSFYTYLARCTLRLLLGERNYSRLTGRTMPAAERDHDATHE